MPSQTDMRRNARQAGGIVALSAEEAAASYVIEPGGCDQWIAVATHPHKERFALANLQRQEFCAYCPMQRKLVRHARRTSEVLRPFFPGYIFAKIGTQERRWRAIHSTFGVRSVIGPAGCPSLLDGAFIGALRAREVDGAIVKPAVAYRVGQQVRLTSGAFDGLVASIIEMDDKDRLTVLLDLLNQSVRVRTDISGVREL